MTDHNPSSCCAYRKVHIVCKHGKPLNQRAGQPVNLQCCCGEKRFCKQCACAMRYDTSDVYCSADCSRRRANQHVANGHRAENCPVRIDVTSMMDSSPRYAHGDCMPRISRPAPEELPRVETSEDGRVLRFIVQRGYQEVTYTGELVGSSLDLKRELGTCSSTLKLDLASVARTVRNVHSDPHFLTAGKHGKICRCECPDCWHVPDADPDGFCNCGECPC